MPGSRILFMGVNAASSDVIKGQFTGARLADTTFSVLTGLSGTTASVLGNPLLTATTDPRTGQPLAPNVLKDLPATRSSSPRNCGAERFAGDRQRRRRHLHVGDLEDRSRQLSTRKSGYDNRFAPYPQP